MAVLPWGHSRNQTNSSTEKSKLTSLDWFSRTPAEPSRKAINQLMKQHTRGTSGGSASTRSRSRAGTPSSQHSHHRSTVSETSRPGSAADVAFERSTPTSSRPATPARPNTSGIERSDSASKSLFQKGGLLRRKGSKIGMNSNTTSAGGLVSPPRPASSRAGLRGRDVATSPIKEDGRRPSISKPFDFTHVMHGDLGAFSGLGRIDESDLASQFDEIQARYRATTEMGSPLPQEPQVLTPTKTTPITSVETDVGSPEKSTSMASPDTPPAPPPKNSPLQSPFVPPSKGFRTYRSTENFSRPTPRSPNASCATSPVRPSSCHLQHLVSTTLPSDVTESTISKPLPHPPILVHAVSTQDDTARLLMSAPLPTPPPTQNLHKSGPRHQRQSSSRSSLRHMSTFPSAKHPSTGTLAQEAQLLGITEEEGLTRPYSDYELSHRTHRYSEYRNSDDKPLDVEDWEVAIDSAWDFEDQAESASDDRSARRSSALSRDTTSGVLGDQSQHELGSLPTTPLMTMTPANHSRSRKSFELSPAIADMIETQRHAKRNLPSLVGLGIDTKCSNTTNSRTSRPLTLEVATPDSSCSSISPHLARSAYSAISHSSSQESIILSIASSIMGTQRSSTSSVCVSDYAHFGKSDRSSVATSSNSPLLTVNNQKPARPESSCLPSALLQQMNAHSQKAARPDSSCLPSVPQSQRNSIVSKAERPESICLPQDMLTTFPVPEKTQRSSIVSKAEAVKEDIQDEDHVSALPSGDLQARTGPGSRASVAQRRASQTNGDNSHSRQRSSTQGSRTRPARVSYSLFPNANPAPVTSSNVDIDAVAA